MSRRYRERLAEARILGPISRGGNPYDIAQAESVMKTLKREEIYPPCLPHSGRRHRPPPTLLGNDLQQQSAALRPELSVAPRP